MDQNQNNNLFDNDAPPPQQPMGSGTEPTGGARVYPSADEPRPYTPPPTNNLPPSMPPAAPKRSNMPWIIAIVVILLLCCCCLVLFGWYAWNNGDAWLEQLSYNVLPTLSAMI